MSELRERVAEAIRAAYWQDVTHGDVDHADDGSEVTDWTPEADAALRVVAEWLGSEGALTVASPAVPLGWCDDCDEERCNYVEHWPSDETTTYRQSWGSFTDRRDAVAELRDQKRAAAVLDALRGQIEGERT